ncbi:MAG: TVP38/TMEM64 family protein, partial [bacterium]
GLQALQVAIFPIPGFFGMLGGFLFGFVPGLIYSQIGTVLGSMLAFFLAKVFGRPLVEKIVSREKLKKFDSLARNKGTLFFLLYYWLPYLPKDAMCYFAGLTPMGYWTYFMISFFGRLPGTISATLIGAGIWQFHIPSWGWITLGALILVVLALAFFYRQSLKKWVWGMLEKDWK